ncbi:FAD/NAD P-binding domain-containing protein [Gloeophyllum trabeum ATCC 11539]|uniref:FAD/NAD P-binding domain-containing protein n=1 Tax=Gloeophyllum trabeum (strain ATCC 11539 / FP-39264 / Madison 617) TaxID=670483 RepID=S7PZI0_GLOTA|nr:FAD/NAD P-binding domain-containing protein [Gloeophyllum trabeum ATCC 11539]EPQ52883.1 FAD/NAD P-binding domain-containing protein [Gloeophyllum trabeum ATCC 11539]
MMLGPRNPRLTASTASFSLSFAIVGGGIAGLSCAIALRRVGHRVVILEQDDGKEREAGGSRVPPNMSKIMIDWGLQEEIDRLGVHTQDVKLMTWESGEIFHTDHWQSELLAESGGDFILMQHQDLRRILREKAESLGAEIRHDSEVVEVIPQCTEEPPIVILRTGETLRPDVVIGAEGRYSRVRDECLRMQDHRRSTGLVAMIKREAMLEHPELNVFTSTFNQEPTLFVLCGDKRSALCFQGGTSGNLALILWAPDDRPPEVRDREPWMGLISRERVEELMGPSNPALAKALELCPGATRLTVMQSANFSDWVHPTAPIVITGDAAHPSLAGSVYASSMAVEDAACLAQLFSYLSRRDQIRTLLSAFQEIRQPRIARVREAEEFMLQQMVFSQSSSSTSIEDARKDLGMEPVSSMDGKPANSPVCDDMIDVFAYEAEDAANDWWVQWGLLYERASGKKVPAQIAVHQVVEEIVH